MYVCVHEMCVLLCLKKIYAICIVMELLRDYSRSMISFEVTRELCLKLESSWYGM